MYEKNNCFTLLRVIEKSALHQDMLYLNPQICCFISGFFAVQEYLGVINTTFILLIALEENKYIPFPTITHLILLLS